MCSSGDSNVASAEAANSALTTQLGADYAITFGENQAIQKQLTGVLQAQITNPTGLPPAEIAAARTNATDTVATQFENATRSANAVSAAHGGAALPSGVSAQVGGQIAAGAAGAESQQQGAITMADANAKQQNYWNALQGLGAVGQAYNPTGYSNSAAGVGSSTANLGSTLLASQQAGWQDVAGIVGAAGGVMTGIAGLGAVSQGNYTGCWLAAACFNEDFTTGAKTNVVRTWLWGDFAQKWYARPILLLYSKYGAWAAQQKFIVRAFTPVFNNLYKRLS